MQPFVGLWVALPGRAVCKVLGHIHALFSTTTADSTLTARTNAHARYVLLCTIFSTLTYQTYRSRVDCIAYIAFIWYTYLHVVRS